MGRKGKTALIRLGSIFGCLVFWEFTSRLVPMGLFPGPRETFNAFYDNQAEKDPEVLGRATPGCKRLVAIRKDAYETELKLGVAGINGEFTGEIEVEQEGFPPFFELSFRGEELPGFLTGKARLDLAARERETEISYRADLDLGAKWLGLGRGSSRESPSS